MRDDNIIPPEICPPITCPNPDQHPPAKSSGIPNRCDAYVCQLSVCIGGSQISQAPSPAMKTSGVVVAALASVSVVEAFLTSPLLRNPSSSALHQSRTTCVSSSARRPRATSQYMVAAPAKEDTVAAVPHGGTLVDLNVKTEDEKKVCAARGSTVLHRRAG